MMRAQTDTRIIVERPDMQKLAARGVIGWPIWTKEPSTFDWHYDEPETCYFLEGEVTVTTDAGEVTIRKGDFVKFPKGLSCTWRVTQAIRKHYRFG